MASEWRDTTIGDFCPFTYGKGLPERTRNSSGKVPVFGSNGLVGRHDEAYVQGPGVIIGRKGTVGAVHYSPVPFWPIDTTFFVSTERSRDIRFTYYLLKSLPLAHMNSDSAVPGLNRDAAHGLKVRVPPLPEQRGIAHILGTLDDKIELNRRMNETLEAMARAIFKSWFVDFDPVIDNALRAGNPIPDKFADRAARRRAALAAGKPIVPDRLARLFPDSFQESDLGPIPSGWHQVALGDVADIHDSKRVPLSKRERAKRKGRYRYYGAAGVLDYVNDYLFDGIYVLVGEDGSVTDDDDHPVVQYVWGQFWVNNHAHVLTGRAPVSTEHLALYLRQAYIRPYVTGAVQPKLNQRNLKSLPFMLPDVPVCGVFDSLIEPIYRQLRVASDQSRTLAATRDTLLPKLLSGEIRAPVQV